MKVCTDACIQGAFTARWLRQAATSPAEILDIGTGTGLLSLMLAQQVPAHITAIELDPMAAAQAGDNFAAAPWKDRLTLTIADVRTVEFPVAFDFIITNPPFYESALKSGHRLKDQAMHATTLNYQELLGAIGRLLQPEGAFSVLLPYEGFLQFCKLAAMAGFFPQEVLEVKQSVEHGVFRAVGIFSRKEGVVLTSGLSVYDNAKVYTPEFVALLKEYYLYL